MMEMDGAKIHHNGAKVNIFFDFQLSVFIFFAEKELPQRFATVDAATAATVGEKVLSSHV